MTTRLTYTHQCGKIYEDRREISTAEAKEKLAANRLGAERCDALRMVLTASISRRFVAELEQAIEAQAIFNRATESGRVVPMRRRKSAPRPSGSAA
jgi:hypothetical protein